MSNDSLNSLPWFSSDSFNRVIAATPPENSPPDFFYVPERTFVLRGNRPLPRRITSSPITPRRITPAFDFSQDGQRITQSGDSVCIATPPRTPRQSRIEEWLQSTLRQSQIEEWLRSSSMSSIVPPENDLLIFGRILSITQPSQNESNWAEDGYNDILVMHLSAYEKQWHKDGVDEDLNLVMDVYESCEGEF
ncbi:hypothetical protein QTP88_021545 [Uroleucon formosanum]